MFRKKEPPWLLAKRLGVYQLKDKPRLTPAQAHMRARALGFIIDDLDDASPGGVMVSSRSKLSSSVVSALASFVARVLVAMTKRKEERK